MSAQILYAKETGKELSFGSLNDTINMTDFLNETVGNLFIEKKYYEEEDEISYRVIEYKDIKKLAKSVRESEEILLDELKTVRGNEKRTELVLKMKDLSLLKQVIIMALLQEGDNNTKVLALL